MFVSLNHKYACGVRSVKTKRKEKKRKTAEHSVPVFLDKNRSIERLQPIFWGGEKTRLSNIQGPSSPQGSWDRYTFQPTFEYKRSRYYSSDSYLNYNRPIGLCIRIPRIPFVESFKFKQFDLFSRSFRGPSKMETSTAEAYYLILG